MERKHSKRLSVNDRVRIVERLRAGEKGINLAKEYGVTKAAISKLKKNANNILAYKDNLQKQHGDLDKKKVTGIENTAFEKALYNWFLQKRSLGEHVSGVALCKKALLFNRHLNGNKTFRASKGWLDRFKKRHGIRELAIQRERLSTDAAPNTEFCTTLRNYIQDFGYKRDQIYNADETGLQWKSLPSKTLAGDDESGGNLAQTKTSQVALDRKVLKDRVTVMVCANASGNHKLPLLVVSKAQKTPHCFRNVKALRVVHKVQKNAWIDEALFMEWYRDVFVPEIEARHSVPNDKCLLLLDNAPCHPPAERLNAISEKCSVIYLPPNETSISQPMHQGVIEKLKKMYRKSLLQELLLNEQYQNIAAFSQQWSLLHCCKFIAAAWDTLTQENIQNSWKKIIGDGNFIEETIGSNMHLRLLQQLPEYSEISIDEAKQWLEEDCSDPGWRVLSDDEILSDDKETSVESEVRDDEDIEIEQQIEEEIPTPKEALHSLDKFVQWYQTKWECTKLRLFQLQQCRDVAIAEIFS